VIADGGVRRDATLGLAALRNLHAGKELGKSLPLRRYILGLSLVAFTAPLESYLRQGCTLVRNPDQPREFVEVNCDGRRQPCEIAHDAALEFATAAAMAFGVGASRTVDFEKDRAKKDVAGDEAAKSKKKGGGK
jgi:CRISPR-associated protein Csb1